MVWPIKGHLFVCVAGPAATLEALVDMLDRLGCKEAVDIVKDVLGTTNKLLLDTNLFPFIYYLLFIKLLG